MGSNFDRMKLSSCFIYHLDVPKTLSLDLNKICLINNCVKISHQHLLSNNAYQTFVAFAYDIFHINVKLCIFVYDLLSIGMTPIDKLKKGGTTS